MTRAPTSGIPFDPCGYITIPSVAKVRSTKSSYTHTSYVRSATFPGQMRSTSSSATSSRPKRSSHSSYKTSTSRPLTSKTGSSRTVETKYPSTTIERPSLTDNPATYSIHSRSLRAKFTSDKDLRLSQFTSSYTTARSTSKSRARKTSLVSTHSSPQAQSTIKSEAKKTSLVSTHNPTQTSTRVSSTKLQETKVPFTGTSTFVSDQVSIRSTSTPPAHFSSIFSTKISSFTPESINFQPLNEIVSVSQSRTSSSVASTDMTPREPSLSSTTPIDSQTSKGKAVTSFSAIESQSERLFLYELYSTPAPPLKLYSSTSQAQSFLPLNATVAERSRISTSREPAKTQAPKTSFTTLFASSLTSTPTVLSLKSSTSETTSLPKALSLSTSIIATTDSHPVRLTTTISTLQDGSWKSSAASATGHNSTSNLFVPQVVAVTVYGQTIYLIPSIQGQSKTTSSLLASNTNFNTASSIPPLKMIFTSSIRGSSALTTPASRTIRISSRSSSINVSSASISEETSQSLGIQESNLLPNPACLSETSFQVARRLNRPEHVSQQICISNTAIVPINLSSTSNSVNTQNASSIMPTKTILRSSIKATSSFTTSISMNSEISSLSSSTYESSASISTETSQSSSIQESTLLPNLACPSQTISEDARRPSESEPASQQICDPNAAQVPNNVSSTTNISNTQSESFLIIDPDKNGTYILANATAEQRGLCLNVAARQSRECWGVLNVTGFLEDWVVFNQDRCDSEQMAFADCYIYIELGSGANCTAFTGRSQCLPPDPRNFASRTNGAQAYYAAFNIWNIQNWFFSYYIALQGANSLSSENVNTIARTLNIPVPKGFPLMDVLAGLAFAFGLLSPSGYGALLPKLGEKVSGFGAQVPGEYLLRAVQNAPTLSRNLLDSSQLSQTDVQVAQLSSDLARVTSQLQNNVQNALISVLSNFTLFMDFVDDGYFSSQIENLNTLAQNITLAFNTYVVSQALQDDEVIITRALDTDVNELQVNGSAVQYDTGCGHGYNEWGMCGNWWYDSMYHVSYGLESTKDMLLNFTDALDSLFSQGITTPQLLFMNSQFCANAAGSVQGNAPGTGLNTKTGVWNTECISNLKICTWDLTNLDVDKEFTDCPTESSFAREGCGQGFDINQALVPISYIGQWLTSGDFEGLVCNKRDSGTQNPG